MPEAAQKGVLLTLLSGVSTGTSAAIAVPPSIRNHSLLIACSSGIGSGTIGLETAPDPNYAGTWSSIGTIGAVADQIRRVLSAPNCFPFIRARITANIVGGTVTVYYVGN